LWNQIPVTLGNLVGGFVFTGLFLYWTYRPLKSATADNAATATVAVPVRT
jgi:formate/nitrite transporter FocA (FNT family)